MEYLLLLSVTPVPKFAGVVQLLVESSAPVPALASYHKSIEFQLTAHIK
jgi:hypothetical protein